MTQIAVIFLAEDDVHSFLVDAESGAVTEQLPSPLPEDVSVLAVVPGQEVLQSSANVPNVSGRRGETAARYAIEDRLAVDPGAIHVATSQTIEEDGSRLIWAVAPDRLEAWTSQLTEQDLAPDVLVPDYALLPLGNDLHVVQMPSGVAIKQGSRFAATVDEDLAPTLLDEFMEQHDDGQVFLAGPHPSRLTPLSGWRDAVVEETGPPHLHELAQKAAKDYAALQLQSLLQGAYRPKTEAQLGWTQWRRPVALVAGAALIWIIAGLVDAWRLSTGAEAAYAQADQVLRDTLPGTTRVVNPRAQLRAALISNGGQSSGFLESAALLNEALANSTSVRVEALRFDPDNGVLNVTLNYDRYQELEQISRTLQARGARVTEGGSRQSGGRVIGDLTVRAP